MNLLDVRLEMLAEHFLRHIIAMKKILKDGIMYLHQFCS